MRVVAENEAKRGIVEHEGKNAQCHLVQRRSETMRTGGEPKRKWTSRE
jgi:hypothetical protein